MSSPSRLPIPVAVTLREPVSVARLNVNSVTPDRLLRHSRLKPQPAIIRIAVATPADTTANTTLTAKSVGGRAGKSSRAPNRNKATVKQTGNRTIARFQAMAFSAADNFPTRPPPL